MKPHKHAAVIKAWADGAEIEVRGEFTDYKWWTFQADYVPSWSAKNEYRIKPKPDVVVYRSIRIDNALNVRFVNDEYTNEWKLTFDGETRKLKDAEVINA